MQRGKYRFTPEYKYLEVPENHWYKMTSQQRQKHLERITHIQIQSPGEVSSLHPPSQNLSLSIDVHEMTDQVNILFSCLQDIWNKAGELLSTAGSIVSAPGHCPEARLVLSRSGKRPHLVLPSKVGFMCDSDCVNFKSLGICSHTVAVAHINDQLPQFVSNLKKAKKQPNLTQLAVHEMPAGAGKNHKNEKGSHR